MRIERLEVRSPRVGMAKDCSFLPRCWHVASKRNWQAERLLQEHVPLRLLNQLLYATTLGRNNEWK
jgi:hypothetical protein